MPMRSAQDVLLAALLLSACVNVRGDLPVHCLLQDVAGDWDVHVGPAVASPPGLHSVIPSCGHHIPNNVVSMVSLKRSTEVPEGSASHVRLTLTEDIAAGDGPRRLRATDASGEEGAWTMVFDEGFEVKMPGQLSFFSHFYFEPTVSASRSPENGDRWTDIALYKGRDPAGINLQPEGDVYACYCNRTSVGWWHRHTEKGLESGCFWATKVQSKDTPPVSFVRMPEHVTGKLAGLWREKAVAEGINATHGHKANLLDAAFGMAKATRKEVLGTSGPSAQAAAAAATGGSAGGMLRGGSRLAQIRRNEQKKATEADLPKSWDWRNELAGMPGKDVLSEQFSQGNCGSCYAFSGTMVLQMRFRAQLLKKHGILYPLELSWKSATRCSPYTEGCNGGFAYPVFKHASEVGLPAADCDRAEEPEKLDESCDWACYKNTTELFYAKDYGFVDGFSHGATEEGIMREIHERGPVILSFSTSAAPEFIYNNGQSYRTDTKVMTLFNNSQTPKETFSKNPKVNPWRYTTHSILAVGYGEEPPADGVSEPIKYWIVRNSWGQDWGKDGYAKMRRGHNDAALETAAPWVEPDLDRLPEGFLERARSFKAGSSEAAAEESADAQDKRKSGGRPAYCKMRPDSIDCQ